MAKQHGSLARAGKVKNQTPKVAPNQDAKAAPSGRAGKREKYNRRFLSGQYNNIEDGMPRHMNKQEAGKLA
jgi:small subunit ribosomal protein S30e